MEDISGIIGFIIIIGIIGIVLYVLDEDLKGRLPTKCSKCQNTFQKNQLRTRDRLLLCPSCLKKWNYCISCGNLVREESLTEYMDRMYCYACFSNRFKKELDGIWYGKTNKIIASYDDYSQHLHSQYWRTIREIALAKSKYKCSRCRTKDYLNAHHLTYENVGNERIEDIQILCRMCHEKEHVDNNSTRDWTGHPTKGSKHAIPPKKKKCTIQSPKKEQPKTKLLAPKPSTQCRAITKKGERCKLEVTKGSSILCHIHIKRLDKNKNGSAC